jgi:hypothetical protein
MTAKQKQGSRQAKESTQKPRPSGPARPGPVVLVEAPDRLLLQRAVADPALASPADVLALQGSYGNRVVNKLLVHRQVGPEEKEATPVQAKPLIQRRDGDVAQANWPQGVKVLTEGIKDEHKPILRLARLCRNFDKLDFTYGTHKANHEGILNTGKGSGDCQNLAQAMVQVAKDYLGIQTVEATKVMDDCLLMSKELTIDRNRPPTVNDGEGWTFANHWIVAGEEGKYDPLFARKHRDGLTPRTKHEDAKASDGSSVEIDTYGETTIYGAYIEGKGMLWWTEGFLRKKGTLPEERAAKVDSVVTLMKQ